MNTKPLSVSSPTNFLDKQSDKFLKLVSTVDGRDKLYKTIQYTARTAWWILNSKDPKNPALAKLSSLDSTFSDARRTFRLGGFIREYKDLVANTPCTPTLMGVFKYTNNLGCFIGETMDLVVWLAKHRAVNVNKDSWEWWRNVLWMLNIFYTLTDQFLLFKQTYQVYLRMKEAQDSESQKELPHVEAKLKSFRLVFIRYIADFFLCSAQLRGYNNKGYTGIFGMFSGVPGVISSWKKL